MRNIKADKQKGTWRARAAQSERRPRMKRKAWCHAEIIKRKEKKRRKEKSWNKHLLYLWDSVLTWRFSKLLYETKIKGNSLMAAGKKYLSFIFLNSLYEETEIAELRFNSAAVWLLARLKTTAKNNMCSEVLTCSQTVSVWVWQVSPPNHQASIVIKNGEANLYEWPLQFKLNPFNLSRIPSSSLFNIVQSGSGESDWERETGKGGG